MFNPAVCPVCGEPLHDVELWTHDFDSGSYYDTSIGKCDKCKKHYEWTEVYDFTEIIDMHETDE